MAGLVDFAYTTLERLESEGIKSASPTDDVKFLSLIRTFSEFINTVTNQVFQPINEVTLLDGNNTSIIWHHKMLPVLKINKISIRSTDPSSPTNLPLQKLTFPRRSIITESSTVLAAGDTDIKGPQDRLIEVRFGEFPDGRGNIVVDAVFGRMDTVRGTDGKTSVFTGTTTGTITKTSTSVILGAGEASNLRPGYTCDIVDSVGVSVRVIITSINYATDTISFIAPGEIVLPDNLTVAASATLTSYGRVPPEIERALLRIIELNKDSIGGTSTTPVLSAGGSIKRERTDEYEIEFFESGEDSARAIPITIDEMIARILDEYVAPPGVWVI